jgi:glutamate-1-semialdehyde 2,1-aminomutase
MKNSDSLKEEYRRSHLGSQALHSRAKEVFSANGTTHMVRSLDPFRPYITHAKGSRKWDVDGNYYIDYVVGHGGLILGHSHPAVVQALQQQAIKGIHYGDNHELEVKWAQLIQYLMPVAERVEFFSCGQEANLMAIRMSRAFTGRKKVLRFKENFHGWADELVHEGSLGAIADHVSVIPCNDLERVQTELATEEYAVLLIEGGGAFLSGRIPTDIEFYQGLPLLTQKYGTVMVLDEVVTGFREAPGGWQSVVGIKPDLTTLGKAVSGGMPAGALIGRADIMDTLNPYSVRDRFISHSGTWNGVPIICAAGIAACELYKAGEPQRKAREMADYLRKRGNEVLRERGVRGRFYGRSCVHLYFGAFDFEPSDDTLPPTKDVIKLMDPKRIPVRNRLCLHLLQRGVASLIGEIFVLSAAHTRDDIDLTVRAFDESICSMITEGTLGSDHLV